MHRQRRLRAVVAYLFLSMVWRRPAVECLECMVGVQECHCGWECTSDLSEAKFQDVTLAQQSRTCQQARPLPTDIPLRKTCPGSADVCLYFADMLLAPYLNGTVVGRARFGNCFRPGTGPPANQSNYYPVFPMPAMPTRNIDSMGLNVGPQGFAGQDFLCIPVHYTQRDSGVDEYLVYCLCRRNLCNLDWTTVANTGPPPPGKDVEALIVDLYNNPNGSAPTLTAFDINNTQTVSATRRPLADTVNDCGTHPDSEDCNAHASPGTRSGATQYQPAEFFYFVCSVLAVWTRRRIV